MGEGQYCNQVLNIEANSKIRKWNMLGKLKIKIYLINLINLKSKRDNSFATG